MRFRTRASSVSESTGVVVFLSSASALVLTSRLGVVAGTHGPEEDAARVAFITTLRSLGLLLPAGCDSSGYYGDGYYRGPGWYDPAVVTPGEIGGWRR